MDTSFEVAKNYEIVIYKSYGMGKEIMLTQ